MPWVGQTSWQGIGGCAHVEGAMQTVVEPQNTPLHAHDLGSGRCESDPVIPRGHGMKTVSGSIRSPSTDIVHCPHISLGVLIRFHTLDKNQNADLKWMRPKSDAGN